MMSRTLTWAALTTCLVWSAPSVDAQRPPAVDVTGAWVMTVDMSMGVASPTLDFKQDGNRLSGVYVSRYGDFPITGALKGRAITFSITMRPDDPITITYTGEVGSDGRTMKGTADLGEMGDATWSAERARGR